MTSPSPSSSSERAHGICIGGPRCGASIPERYRTQPGAVFFGVDDDGKHTGCRHVYVNIGGVWGYGGVRLGKGAATADEQVQAARVIGLLR